MENRKKVLQKIFLSTLYLSAFTFGGGYVIVTLMKKKFVDEYGWIREDEMLDLIAIAQSAPGAIAVNGAIVVGYKLAGMAGAVTAIVATVIPPFVIISLISVCYELFRDNFIVSQILEGMQAGVAAVIAAVVWEMGAGIVRGKDPASLTIMAGAFAAACIFQVNVVWIVIVCALLGVIRTLWGRRHDLFAAVRQFPSDRAVQLRRRLRGHAADPASGGDAARLAEHVGVYRSDYHISDDARAHRYQFRHLCGRQDRGNLGGGGGHSRLYPSILHYRHGDCQTLSEIPQHGHAAGGAEFSAAGGGSHDRLGGDIGAAFCALGRRRDLTGRNQLDAGSYFHPMSCLFAERQMESHRCHGTGGYDEAYGGFFGHRMSRRALWKGMYL